MIITETKKITPLRRVVEENKEASKGSPSTILTEVVNQDNLNKWTYPQNGF